MRIRNGFESDVVEEFYYVSTWRHQTADMGGDTRTGKVGGVVVVC
jgi:hypothetical protein